MSDPKALLHQFFTTALDNNPGLLGQTPDQHGGTHLTARRQQALGSRPTRTG